MEKHTHSVYELIDFGNFDLAINTLKSQMADVLLRLHELEEENKELKKRLQIYSKESNLGSQF
jgi:archaellum component FlaC